jgi:hypothetical protein
LTCPWVYEHANPQTVAVTLEVPWNADASTISGYRSVGEGGLLLPCEQQKKVATPQSRGKVITSLQVYEIKIEEVRYGDHPVGCPGGFHGEHSSS